MLDVNKFKEFLIEAKKNTYAGEGETTASSRPLSKDLPYHKGLYFYLDSYFGDVNFIGEEVVWIDNKVVWGMNYYGEMLVENIPADFSKCLKGALAAAPYHAPYRGPESFSYCDLEYRCEWNGDIGSFYGEEFISSNGKIIYKLKFHGGFISFFN